MSEPRAPSRLRRWLAGGAWGTGAIALAVAAAAGWLAFTAGGARFVVERAAALAGGRVGAVEGRLAGPLTLASLEFATDAVRVRATRVALDWSPLRLLEREVRVERLHVAELDIVTLPSDKPARVPDALGLPLRLRVEQAGVDRLRVGATDDAQEGVWLRAVSTRFAAGPNAWIVADARADTPIGRATLAGTLGAAAPFPLEARGELLGERGSARYRATVAARGPLAQFEATLAGAEGGLTGEGRATVMPFHPVPLRRLVAKLDGLDLAAFTSSPVTKLAVQADLAPRADALLAGPVSIANAAPGPLDRQRVPVTAARGDVAFGGGRLEARRVVLGLDRGGSAQGEATWADGRLEAAVTVTGGDLLAWHTALRPTALAGTIAATVTGDVQSFTVALADPRFAVEGEARLAGGGLQVPRVKLTRGDASAQAQGTLAFGGDRAFTVAGRFERLDPAAFAAVPAGEINADFTVQGRLAGTRAGEARVVLARSRYAGLAAEGRLAVAGEGTRLVSADADLALGATRLVARGALGRADDALAVRVTSPDLAPLGRAFRVDLGGRVDLDARVAGAFEALSGTAALEARSLVLPGGVRAGHVAGRVALGAGEAGVAQGRVEVRDLAIAGTPRADRATLAVSGTRALHDLRLEADLPERHGVRALLTGGFVANAPAPAWRGRLESLESTGEWPLALTTPAPLFLSAGQVELREATLAGEPGQANLALVRWSPAGLEARGTSRGVVLRPLTRLLGLQGRLASTLVVAGQWDVRVGDTVDGTVELRRERGDVRVGEPRQALGLEAFTLRAQADGGRVAATLDLRGQQVGSWQAQLAATVRRGEAGWEVAPAAPVEGRFTVDVPDLAWTAAWLGPDARAGGRLRGEGRVAGTARDPEWSGRVEATGLALRESALGAEVDEGTIVLDLKDRHARLERFVLATAWKPEGEAARALAGVPRPARGTLAAEGAFDLAARKGEVRVVATAFPYTRLATRFSAVSGEGRATVDGTAIVLTGDFRADAGWFGVQASAPPSLSDDVIVERGEPVAAARPGEHVRLDLRADLGEHTYFRGRGLATRLAGGIRLAGEPGPNLRATGAIRAVGGTYDAYGRTLTLERGALNFAGPLDNPALNVLALRKGLPVEAGVEIVGTVNRPKARLVSVPDVPDPEKLAWLVLGRGQGEVSAADATTLVAAANAMLGREAMPAAKLLGGLGLDDVRIGRDDAGALGTLPQSTVAGRTGAATAAEVVTVGRRLTDDIHVSYRQGLADAEGSLRVVWQFTRSLQLILRAGYRPGVDGVYRFSFD